MQHWHGKAGRRNAMAGGIGGQVPRTHRAGHRCKTNHSSQVRLLLSRTAETSRLANSSGREKPSVERVDQAGSGVEGHSDGLKLHSDSAGTGECPTARRLANAETRTAAHPSTKTIQPHIQAWGDKLALSQPSPRRAAHGNLAAMFVCLSACPHSSLE